MIDFTSKLQTFREALYGLFPKRKDAIMNLLDAITSHGRQCNSVVQLSNANCFKRQYSSITDAIADGLPEAKWDEIEKLVYQQIAANSKNKPHRFIVDCTPNPRPYAKKLVDRHITHAPNPAPGNKPICVGHQYSVVTLLPNEPRTEEKHWLVPVSAKRVESKDKGNEVGMVQLINCINELGLADEMCISIADSLYGTQQCRQTASEQPNLVHLFRLNGKRNVFAMPTDNPKESDKKGRKKEFGLKMKLGDPSTYLDCDHETQTPWKTKKGKEYTVTIKCWKDRLLRGSRKFRSSLHPFNLIQVSVTNEQGEAVFKKPLWLAVFGKRRHEISLIEAYQNYKSRYDIEHFFRFGKRNLLLDSYQTSDVAHEELWWRLCLLGYMQLYLSKESVDCLPQPWERYLPEYKNIDNKEQVITSPAQTQRGFINLLKTIGTPASHCVARGKPRGRTEGESQIKRTTHSIVFKTKKTTEKSTETIVSGSEPEKEPPNPERIDVLINLVQASLAEMNLTPEKFSEMLVNSS